MVGAAPVIRLNEWLHVFSSEFSSEMQNAALKELISRTRCIAEQGNQLEGLLKRKRKSEEREDGR